MNQLAYSDYQQAEFVTVDDALDWAYAHESKQVIKNAALQTGSNGTNPSDLNVWDKIAYAAMIIRHVDMLPLYPRYAITARKTKDYRVKRGYCKWLGGKIGRDLGRNRTFCTDVARRWAGIPMKKTFKEWAREFKKDERTLYRWAMETKSTYEQSHGKYSISDKLNEYNGIAENKLKIIYLEKNIIRG